MQQRRLLFRNFLPLAGICLCLYFSYHTLQGHRSVVRLISLNHAIEDAEVHHAALVKEHEELERSVVMMRPGSVDPDMLEEQARKILGYRHPDDLDVLESR